MIIPIILAGGTGTRLWPLSRKLYPKQLIALLDDKTLIQNTVNRVADLEDVQAPVVICNEEHRFMVAEQMREAGVKPESIILEPFGRNTAPAVTIAALSVAALQPQANLLVLPADHLIQDTPKFHEAVRLACEMAQADRLVTFGIVPTAPETGYGYIRKGDRIQSGPDSLEVSKIERFVEKPDAQTAKSYLESGDYLWNSGMFVFKAQTLLDEVGAYAPEIVEACRQALATAGSDLDFLRLGADAFGRCPEDSIDYAVMERTSMGAVIPLSSGWNDLGSWDALWHDGVKDENGNVSRGDVVLHDVRGSYLHAETRLLTAVGLENHIVVETSDAVLVAPKDRVQDVKKIVDKLKAAKREEAISHTKIYRPWGNYESIDVGERYQVKRIVVHPGQVLSLQKHFHRAEHWVVVRGTAVVKRDAEEILLQENESVYLPLGAVHRLANPGKIPLELIEVQVGSYLGEDDIVRFEDVYGR